MARIKKSANSTPGVSNLESPLSGHQVIQVETAIPAFIGYTQTALNEYQEPLLNIPTKIHSLIEYENFFGRAEREKSIYVTVKATTTDGHIDSLSADALISSTSPYTLYYHLKLFFLNGGGPCYIISIGHFGISANSNDYLLGLQSCENQDEPTLLAFPDAISLLNQIEYYSLISSAIEQCVKLRDRFVLVDIHTMGRDNTSTIRDFRNSFTRNENLDYAAAYYPQLITSFNYLYEESDVNVELITDGDLGGAQNIKLDSLKTSRLELHALCLSKIRKKIFPTLPPSAAIAGIFAKVDGTMGVWKAPANVSLQGISGLAFKITNEEQEFLNVDPISGKSVNAIREFPGKGYLVWGARTLAGNDNEWRYVSVRRFFIMVEESAKKAIPAFLSQPNTSETWISIRNMLENFLLHLWRKGALAGNKSEDSFYVKCGLGQTMTEQDIQEGTLIEEIGMAVVSPAEFIVLRFAHKMTPAPPERITTLLTWEHLVLPPAVSQQIKELEVLFNQEPTQSQPGRMILFYGPSGTGKTLTASLLGKYTGREVYRIDLSKIKSKYIGETEKNLSRLFEKAADKDWILFFDEADAIFGRRTEVKDAHDKYANQEVSYLLEKMQTYPGFIILTSTLKENLDSAFIRRLHYLIHFPPPKPKERLKLWTKYLAGKTNPKTSINLKELAHKYKLTGANIKNISQNVLDTKKLNLSEDDLIQGIRKELKEREK